MSWVQAILLGILVISAIIGYLLIKHVPSLLHTPLMSGMNALSGITLLGALVATAYVIKIEYSILSVILGGIAVIAATLNVVAGFLVTDRMLAMFKGSKHDN